jgi:hypothetical protein
MVATANPDRSLPVKDSGYHDAVAVTPNDSTDLARTPTHAVFVGGAGTLKVDMAGGTTVTFSGITANTLLPISVTRVYATGTSATLILALY